MLFLDVINFIEMEILTFVIEKTVQSDKKVAEWFIIYKYRENEKIP